MITDLLNKMVEAKILRVQLTNTRKVLYFIDNEKLVPTISRIPISPSDNMWLDDSFINDSIPPVIENEDNFVNDANSFVEKETFKLFKSEILNQVGIFRDSLNKHQGFQKSFFMDEMINQLRIEILSKDELIRILKEDNDRLISQRDSEVERLITENEQQASFIRNAHGWSSAKDNNEWIKPRKTRKNVLSTSSLAHIPPLMSINPFNPLRCADNEQDVCPEIDTDAPPTVSSKPSTRIPGTFNRRPAVVVINIQKTKKPSSGSRSSKIQ